MNITTKVENFNRDIRQVTEVSIIFEENLDYQFDQYQIIFSVFLVILFICNIVVLICLLRI